jgi:hypothetical protein
MICVAALPAVLMVSACGSATDATPTLSLEGIATSAYMTFSAEMATKIALTPPTNTPAPLPSPLPTLPPLSPLPTFAASASTPLTSGSSGSTANCNDAAYIADVSIPDDTKLDPGQKFTKTWRIQNTGTCAWTTAYKLSFLDGTKMNGSDAFVPLGVPVGNQTEMSVPMNAPTSSGQYYGRWQMKDDKGNVFGSILTVVIKVNFLEPTATTAAP